ncbi:hypothetical protein ACT3TC_12275 [Halomonas sp. AOP27-A1-41]|uniref:hypothetical protein n=1 Tax=Halomonas sp. AOP27-A1-41 TaxID=3457707 RepID=UPI0040335272
MAMDQQYTDALKELEQVKVERDELAAHAETVVDTIGFPARHDIRRQTCVIVTNIQNCWRFAKYLHAIENKFFMVPGEPDEDYPDDECLVNSWGSTEEQYIDQFAKAIAIKQTEAIEQWAECLENIVSHIEARHSKDPNYPDVSKVCANLQ